MHWIDSKKEERESGEGEKKESWIGGDSKNVFAGIIDTMEAVSTAFMIFRYCCLHGRQADQ